MMLRATPVLIQKERNHVIYMDQYLSFKVLYKIFTRRIIWLAMMCVLATLIAGLYTMTAQKKAYMSSTQVLVVQNTSAVNVNQLQTNRELIRTFKELILSDDMLSRVSQELDDVSVELLESMISVDMSDESQSFKIVTRGSSPKQNALVANTVRAQLQQDIAQYYGGNVELKNISEAKPSTKIIAKSVMYNVVWGNIIAFILYGFVAMGMELADRSIKDKSALEERQIRVLGQLSKNTTNYLNMKTLIDKQRTSNVMVFAPISNEKMDHAIYNLASSYILDGKKIAVIDLNFEEPTLHHAFNIKNDHGLSNVTEHYPLASLEDDAQKAHYMITAGTNSSARMNQVMLDALKTLDLAAKFDCVFFNAPKLLDHIDVLTLSDIAEVNVILLVEEYKSKLDLFEENLKLLHDTHITVIGAMYKEQ